MNIENPDLGLSKVKNEPSEINEENEKTEEISGEGVQHENEKKEFQLEKEQCSNVLDSAKSLIRVFAQRKRDNLDSLLADDKLDMINTAISDITELLEKDTFVAKIFDEGVTVIAESIDSIGQDNKKPSIKESPEGLGAISVVLKKLKDGSDGLINVISEYDPQQIEETIKILQNLSETCKEKQQYTNKLRDSLENYFRR